MEEQRKKARARGVLVTHRITRADMTDWIDFFYMG
jgi:hypothetical protein